MRPSVQATRYGGTDSVATWVMALDCPERNVGRSHPLDPLNQNPRSVAAKRPAGVARSLVTEPFPSQGGGSARTEFSEENLRTREFSVAHHNVSFSSRQDTVPPPKGAFLPIQLAWSPLLSMRINPSRTDTQIPPWLAGPNRRDDRS